MTYTLVLETPDGKWHPCRLEAPTPEIAKRRARYIRNHGELELLKQRGLSDVEAVDKLREKGHFIKEISMEPDEPDNT